MKLSLSSTREERDKFSEAIASGNAQELTRQFATVLEQRDKFYLVAKFLCVQLSENEEEEGELLLTKLLNKIAERVEGNDASLHG